MPFLKKFSAVSFAISSLFVANAGAAGHVFAHQRGPDAVSRHSAASRRRSPRPLVSRAIWVKVYKVHECEESASWHVPGPLYFGGLGWLWSTWQQWRSPGDPINMANATPMEQARAMYRFVTGANGGIWPHQGWPADCGTGY